MSAGSCWRTGFALGVCTCLVLVNARGRASDDAAADTADTGDTRNATVVLDMRTDWQGLRLLMSEAERRFSEVRWVAVGLDDARRPSVVPAPVAEPASAAAARSVDSAPAGASRRAPAARAQLCSDRGGQSILGTRLRADAAGNSACR